MTNLIHKQDIAAQRKRIAEHFEHVHELRKNHTELDDVFGAPYLYRPDGTALDDQSVQFGVWNMRRAPPIITISTTSGPVQVLGRLGDPPCEFPDLADIVVVDCSVDRVLDELLARVPDNWESPLNKKLFKTPKDMLAVGVGTACAGDLPWEAKFADAAMRKAYGWDQHDLDGNPWVQFEGQAFSVKTQRLQANARAAMLLAGAVQVPLHEGNPVGPNSKEIGVFRHATS